MRSRFVDASGRPKYTNRLIDDSSPYLVQHAHNPVDWYPWGEAAFAKAKQENKPVFLSIGYSTCHWCHVMEQESFDNEAIAAFLNEHFVSIKLDREQRPDLDELYMTGLQLISGQGGWPMSNFVTPDAKPFFAGTYFPPEQFQNLLEQVANAWATQREELENQADQLSTRIELQSRAAAQAAVLDAEVAESGLENLLASFDAVNGGFGFAPKFPNESQLWLFASTLQYRADDQLKQVLLHSLRKMAEGGVYDQVGGGFHRYSTDEKWLVPHFEKMLYNQSQLLRLYAAGVALGELSFERIIKQTMAYLCREMRAEDGSFYSATDADSEGEEGTFFVWEYSELVELLDPEERFLAEKLLGVSEAGNFEGKNVLELTTSLAQFAEDHAIELHDLENRLEQLQVKLRQERDKREPPFLDQKILASWNGQLITSLVQMELFLGDSEYRDFALDVAGTLWRKHLTPDLQLLRSRLGDSASVTGTLEDYAYVAEAFLYLYLVTRDKEWCERATHLLAVMAQNFWDEEQGGFFNSRADQEGPLIVRTKSPMDTAMPSANGVVLSALVLAFEATGELHYLQKARELTAAFSGVIKQSPAAHPFLLATLQRLWQGSRETVQWAAGGEVHIAYDKASKRLAFTVAEGWHINHPDAEQQADLIGLSISGAGFTCPEPSLMDAGFQAEPIPVLEGEFEVELTVPERSIEIRLQVCSDSICQQPQTLVMTLPV